MRALSKSRTEHQIADEIHAVMHLYGVTHRALKRAGLWDEYAGREYQEFRVRVEYEIRHDDTEIVTVRARCDEEAIEKAYDKIQNDCDYDIEVTGADVLQPARRAAQDREA